MLQKSQEEYKGNHDQHVIDKSFIVGDKLWLHLNKQRLQGLVRISRLYDIVPLRYEKRWEITPIALAYILSRKFT